MARWKERQDDNREERLRHGREQISTGDLVGQITASERRHWEQRSADFYEHSAPEERTRKEAARQRRQENATLEQNPRDASLPR